jgi:hypothetical protein
VNKRNDLFVSKIIFKDKSVRTKNIIYALILESDLPGFVKIKTRRPKPKYIPQSDIRSIHLTDRPYEGDPDD